MAPDRLPPAGPRLSLILPLAACLAGGEALPNRHRSIRTSWLERPDSPFSDVTRSHLPLRASSHESPVSASMVSRTERTSRPIAASSTGTTSSIRSSRLRVIRSALPMNRDDVSPASKRKTRLCSRNRPRMLRTRMLLLMPGMPGTSEHMLLAITCTCAPASDARYSSVIRSRSVSALTLMTMREGSPASAAAAHERISSLSRLRRLNGATRILRNLRGCPNPVR